MEANTNILQYILTKKARIFFEDFWKKLTILCKKVLDTEI